MNEPEKIQTEEPITKTEIPPPLPVGAMVNPFRMYKREETPYVTYGILGILIVIYLATEYAGNTLLLAGALHGPSVLFGEYWRMFTAMFLHAGLFHIGFNGYALAIMGSDMERLYGRGRFLAIYILCGLFGSLASFAIRAVTDVPSVGASGAIFGIMGVNLGFFLYYRQKLGDFGTKRFNDILRVTGFNLLIGFVALRIDNAAHIGGLIAGFALGYLLVPRYYVIDSPFADTQIEDRGGLAHTWWIVLLAAVLFVGLTAGVIFYWRTVMGI